MTLFKNLAVFTLLVLSLSVGAQAKPGKFNLLSKSKIMALLGPYPAVGSVEEAQDFELMLQWQEGRTKEQCDLAAHEETATFSRMFGDLLTRREMNRVQLFVVNSYAEAGLNVAIAKNIYKRPRPYLSNPQIEPCIKRESSYAYPSGHTTMARVFAQMLSAVYPDRTEKFLARAKQVALNRVLGGVHHPSDIVAGEKLADALSTKIMKSEKFQQGLKSL